VGESLRSPLARVWLPVLGAAAVAATLDRRSDAGDLLYFVHQGERLLSAHWSGTFADPTLQSGPLQLLVAGGLRSTEALAYVIELAVAALVLVVLGRLGVAGRHRLLVGLGAVVLGLAHGAFVDGHPAEAIGPLLWVLAALEARRGRVIRAGVIVGLSAGLELWGLLGVAVLMLAPRLREAAKGAVVAAAVVAVQLAPFVLFGRFGMLDYEWRVAHGTLLATLVPIGTHFGWPLRLVQAGLAVGAGGAVAWRLRGSVHAVWLAPLAVVLVRILLDPVAYGWYWLEAEALALAGAGVLLTVPPLRVRAAPAPTPAAPPAARP